MSIERIAHDLRAPIHTIVGMLELLKTTKLDDTQRRYLTTCLEAAMSLANLTDAVLDELAVDDNGDDTIDDVYSPRDVAERTAGWMALRAQQKGLSIAAVVDNSLSRLVRGDAARVEQVLTNLVVNAVKYTSHGEVVIRVVAVGGAVVFSVTDTGQGIPVEEQARIFQPFTRMTAHEGEDGVGLGLAICSEIVTGLGGTIGVDSEVGVGSRFWFRLPHAAMARTPTLPPIDLSGQRCLLVRGAPGASEALTMMLSSWGALVSVDAHIPDALPAASIVVIDEPSDVELEHLRGHRVIALYAQRQLASLSINELGEVLPLGKPVRRHELLRALQRTHKRKTSSVTLSGGIDLAGVRVLIVDDVAANVLYARTVLELCGAVVQAARSGEEALTKLAHDAYSLVLLDVQLGDMDGAAVLARLHERGDTVPVVVLSAAADDETVARVKAAGAVHHKVKPVFATELLALVATHARRERQQAQNAMAQKLREAQMALVRRDFRGLALVAGAIRLSDPDLATSLEAALGKRDAAALQLILSQASSQASSSVSTTRASDDDDTAPSDIREAFLVEIEKDKAQLQASADEVDRIAHRLAGSAPMVGFSALGDVARRVMNDKDGPREQRAFALVQAIDAALVR